STWPAGAAWHAAILRREQGNPHPPGCEWTAATGPVVDGSRPSVDRARDGQPRLAAPLRPRTGRHAVESRAARRSADAPGAARLPRRLLHAPRLVDQGHASLDPEFGDLAAIERREL